MKHYPSHFFTQEAQNKLLDSEKSRLNGLLISILEDLALWDQSRQDILVGTSFPPFVMWNSFLEFVPFSYFVSAEREKFVSDFAKHGFMPSVLLSQWDSPYLAPFQFRLWPQGDASGRRGAFLMPHNCLQGVLDIYPAEQGMKVWGRPVGNSLTRYLWLEESVFMGRPALTAFMAWEALLRCCHILRMVPILWFSLRFKKAELSESFLETIPPPLFEDLCLCFYQDSHKDESLLVAHKISLKFLESLF